MLSASTASFSFWFCFKQDQKSIDLALKTNKKTKTKRKKTNGKKTKDKKTNEKRHKIKRQKKNDERQTL